MQRRRAVARHERRCIHGVAVVAHGERARGVGEHRYDRQRLAGERVVEVRGVVHPDVGATEAGRRQPIRRQVGTILSARRGGDEGAIAIGTGENDVARLVTDGKRPQHARRSVETNDADRIGQVIDDPHLARIALGDRHRLESHGDRAGERHRIAQHRVDFEAVGGRIGDEQTLPIGGQCDGPDGTGFEDLDRSRRGVGGLRIDAGAALEYRLLKDIAERCLDLGIAGRRCLAQGGGRCPIRIARSGACQAGHEGQGQECA